MLKQNIIAPLKQQNHDATRNVEPDQNVPNHIAPRGTHTNQGQEEDLENPTVKERVDHIRNML